MWERLLGSVYEHRQHRFCSGLVGTVVGVSTVVMLPVSILYAMHYYLTITNILGNLVMAACALVSGPKRRVVAVSEPHLTPPACRPGVPWCRH